MTKNSSLQKDLKYWNKKKPVEEKNSSAPKRLNTIAKVNAKLYCKIVDSQKISSKNQRISFTSYEGLGVG